MPPYPVTTQEHVQRDTKQRHTKQRHTKQRMPGAQSITFRSTQEQHTAVPKLVEMPCLGCDAQLVERPCLGCDAQSARLQGHTEGELPEQLLGTARLNHLDLSTARELDTTSPLISPSSSEPPSA